MDGRTFLVRTKDGKVAKHTKTGAKMSVKEFEEWIDGMDTNGDGVISRRELEQAFKSKGTRFTKWKIKRAMASADINENGIVDSDLELKKIIEYAQKNWGLTIYLDQD